MSGISDLARWLAAASDVAVVTHVHPDGDALGTSGALVRALTRMGKRAACLCDDPAPHNLAFLPVEVYQPENVPFAPRYVLVCDAGSEDRIGRCAGLLSSADGAATLDHHGTSQGIGDVRVIDGGAAATGVLALALIHELGVEPDRDMAALLYAAVATDTGNFSFRNTNPAAMRAAAECLEAGIDLDDMNFRLFRARRMQKTRLIGAAIDGMSFLMEGRLAVIRVDRAMLDRCGAASEDIDTIVNFGMDTEGVQVSMLIEQRGDAVKASLRSRGDIDVAALAKKLGGGGHKNAAGATLEGTMAEVETLLVRMIGEILE